MNILFVSESLWMEGVVYDLHSMAEGLSLLGHRIYAVDPGNFSEKEPDGDLPHGFQNVSRVHSEACVLLKSPRFKRTFFGKLFGKIPVLKYIYKSRKIYSAISKIIRNEHINIVVLYSVARCGAQTIHLAKKHNIPIVFRNIDMLYKLWPTTLEKFAVRVAEEYVYPRMDMLLALTPKYAEYLIGLGADMKKIKLLPFPIDLNKFNPAIDCSAIRRKWNLDDDDQVIVFIGALYEFGGLIDFIHQFPTILKHAPKAKLLIVGDGPIRPKLEETIDYLDINENAIITGHQPFSAVPEFINAAAICFNAFPINKYTQDIFSAKIIQYQACGKAVVSSALPGITTMLPGESCGVIYVDDFIEMASEIISLLKSPERQKRLGQAGLDYVRNNHSEDHIIRKLESELKNRKGEKSGKKDGEHLTLKFFKAIYDEILWLIANSSASIRHNKSSVSAGETAFENRLYNSANDGFSFYRAGQRLNRIPVGAILSRVSLYMDKMGNPQGMGSCVVRKVSDDSIVGTAGTVDVSRLPDASALRPKWILFKENRIKFPNKEDYRIVFEWDTLGGDQTNYPRVRYNDTDTIKGVFTNYNSDGRWFDHHGSDTSIKIKLER